MRLKRYSNFALAMSYILSFFFLRQEYSSAQPPDAGPQFQAQTKKGFTVRLRRVFWNTPQIADRREAYAGKGLVVEFEAENADTPRAGDLSNYLTDIQVRGPHGETIPAQRDGWESIFFLSGINPQWSELSLDFGMQIPSPDWSQVRGEITKSLDFENVILPTESGQTVARAQTLTGAWGTKVTLRDVTLKTTPQSNGALAYIFLMDFEADQKIPDIAFSVFNGGSSFENAAGQVIANSWATRNPVTTEVLQPTRRRQRWELIVEKSRLNPQELLKAVKFKFNLVEWAPSRKQAANFRQFHFKVPLKNLPDFTPFYKNRSIAKMQSSTVKVEVEDWGKSGNGNVLRLWTRPLNARATNGWLIKSAWMGESRYPVSQIRPLFYTPGRGGWKSDGRIAAANEYSFDFWPGLTLPQEDELQEDEKPESHPLKVELHEARHVASRFSFPNLPVPVGNRIIPLNRVLRDVSGAEWTILSVANYHDGKPPAKWPVPMQPIAPKTASSMMKYLEASNGIALACRWKPAGGIKTIQASHRFTADDQIGHSMLDETLNFLLPTPTQEWPMQEFSNLREMVPGAPNAVHEFTLLVLPPGRGVSKFKADFSVQEVITTGVQQTIIIPLTHTL